MRRVGGIRLVLVLLLGGVLAGCGGEATEGHTIGPPNKTVGQLKDWPQGFQPEGGGFRLVPMPPEAKKHLAEATPEAEGARRYLETLAPR